MDQILAVLVLYQLKLTDSPAYQTLDRTLARLGGTGDLFVYDNSPVEGPLPTQSRWRIHYKHDVSNPGVSKAYNQAFDWAMKTGRQWLLLADQDTSFPEDALAQYLASMDAYPDCHLFVPILEDSHGVLSPFRRLTATGKRLANIKTGPHSIHRIQAVNSGLLVSTSLFAQLHGYDERLRLDFSDFSFFGRATGKTDVLVVADILCRHHHSSSRSELPAAVSRFKTYLLGARVMAQEFGSPYFRIQSILRAIRLCWQYRSTQFIGQLLFAKL